MPAPCMGHGGDRWNIVLDCPLRDRMVITGHEAEREASCCEDQSGEDERTAGPLLDLHVEISKEMSCFKSQFMTGQNFEDHSCRPIRFAGFE